MKNILLLLASLYVSSSITMQVNRAPQGGFKGVSQPVIVPRSNVVSHVASQPIITTNTDVAEPIINSINPPQLAPQILELISQLSPQSQSHVVSPAGQLLVKEVDLPVLARSRDLIAAIGEQSFFELYNKYKSGFTTGQQFAIIYFDRLKSAPNTAEKIVLLKNKNLVAFRNSLRMSKSISNLNDAIDYLLTNLGH